MQRRMCIGVVAGMALVATFVTALAASAAPPPPGRGAHPGILGASAQERVLVILVQFAGTDVFTWTAPTTAANPTGGSDWDPLGKIDPAAALGPGDCSKIITETKKFTYTGPLRNSIERPRSAADVSGASIWTPDFSADWFKSYLFGSGVVIDYTRQDGSPVYASFSGKSLKDYYGDASNRAYTIDGDVVGWLDLPHSTWYYGADRCPGGKSGGTDTDGGIPGAGSPAQLVRDSLQALNAISKTIPGGFDWNKYDANGDGIIDRLWIIHAGYGEEEDGSLLNRMPIKDSFYGEAALLSQSSSLNPPFPVAPGLAAAQLSSQPKTVVSGWLCPSVWPERRWH
jgi:hypothetical protein